MGTRIMELYDFTSASTSAMGMLIIRFRTSQQLYTNRDNKTTGVFPYNGEMMMA